MIGKGLGGEAVGRAAMEHETRINLLEEEVQKIAGLAKDALPERKKLRESAKKELVQLGVPLVHVMGLMRHSDITTTMRYAHLAPENSRDAVGLLDDHESRLSHVGKTREKKDKAVSLITS